MGLVSSEQGLDLLGDPALFDHFGSDRDTYFLNDPDDVPGCRVGGRANDEIGCGQCVKVGNMAVDKMGHIEQLPQFHSCGWWCHAVDGICSFTAGHVMAPGAYTANLCDDLGEFFYRPSNAELFESPEFRDLEIDILHAAIVF